MVFCWFFLLIFLCWLFFCCSSHFLPPHNWLWPQTIKSRECRWKTALFGGCPVCVACLFFTGLLSTKSDRSLSLALCFSEVAQGEKSTRPSWRNTWFFGFFFWIFFFWMYLHHRSVFFLPLLVFHVQPFPSQIPEQFVLTRKWTSPQLKFLALVLLQQKTSPGDPEPLRHSGKKKNGVERYKRERKWESEKKKTKKKNGWPLRFRDRFGGVFQRWFVPSNRGGLLAPRPDKKKLKKKPGFPLKPVAGRKKTRKLKKKCRMHFCLKTG